MYLDILILTKPALQIIEERSDAFGNGYPYAKKTKKELSSPSHVIISKEIKDLNVRGSAVKGSKR